MDRRDQVSDLGEKKITNKIYRVGLRVVLGTDGWWLVCVCYSFYELPKK